MSTLALRLWEQGRALGGCWAGSTEELEEWSREDAGHPEEDSAGSQEVSEQEQMEPMAKRPISRPTAL